MKIYFHPMSSNARKALMVDHHLGLSSERVLVDIAKGAQRDPAFLALNPCGVVPVLVDGDVVLPESHAIMMYLCDKAGHKGRSLYPTELLKRAQVHRWLFWMSCHLSPACAGLNFENMIKGMMGQGGPDASQVARHETFFKKHANVLDDHLASRPWVAADHLTIADYAIASAFMYIAMAKLPVQDHKHVLAWFERIQALPAWQATETAALMR